MIQLAPLPLIKSILQNSSEIAVVGLSPKPARPSYQVSKYMISSGYEIIPVNPGQSEILGRKCYPDLLSVPVSVDIVNIFRRSEHVLPIVEAAILMKAKVIWMQEGIVNDAAAQLAVENNMSVIMDRCIMIDHQEYVHRTSEV